MELAAACGAEGLRVVPVPGACAAVAAVSVAGFPSHEFVFFGFVSGKRGSAVRRRKLAEIAQVFASEVGDRGGGGVGRTNRQGWDRTTVDGYRGGDRGSGEEVSCRMG